MASAPPARAGYEHFPHGADVGVRGFGPTKAAAFEQAALALTAVITDPATVEPREPVAIRCSAPDDELLLVEWLNEVIYAMATLDMLFSRFRVTIQDGELVATAWGEPVDRARHRPAVEIKGATYTALAVRREPNGRWVAECVVDV
ncbi:Protein archease [bacterium HR40]|nr:Protein archease [bacterium HR40]